MQKTSSLHPCSKPTDKVPIRQAAALSSHWVQPQCRASADPLRTPEANTTASLLILRTIHQIKDKRRGSDAK